MSLDGYVADKEGKFDWAAPDEEVHTFVNDLERTIGTHLYGRRMYEVMAFWETAHTLPDEPPQIKDFAEIWQAADKVVYSRSLEAVTTARTGLKREFDPQAVREMKAKETGDISIGGNPALPEDVLVKLELVDEHRFRNGTVHLHYRTSS
jgi:dihydrofolate reductase